VTAQTSGDVVPATCAAPSAVLGGRTGFIRCVPVGSNAADAAPGTPPTVLDPCVVSPTDPTLVACVGDPQQPVRLLRATTPQTPGPPCRPRPTSAWCSPGATCACHRRPPAPPGPRSIRPPWPRPPRRRRRPPQPRPAPSRRLRRAPSRRLRRQGHPPPRHRPTTAPADWWSSASPTRRPPPGRPGSASPERRSGPSR
jgi:hypothetical protein